MTLTLERVVPYLLKRRLLEPSSIVDGDLVVLDASRRNRNFQVVRKHGDSFFLKQGLGTAARASVAYEASIYDALWSGKDTGFQSFLPAMIGYDASEGLLLLELIPEARDLQEIHARRGTIPSGLAADLGQALAILHAKKIENVQHDDPTHDVTHGPPWSLSIHIPNASLVNDLSGGNVEVIKAIQHAPDFGDRLDELMENWKPTSFIHFDVKWENCLVKRGSEQSARSLKIIDWEFAGMGDSCWDVACVFAAYLRSWVLSVPFIGNTPTKDLPNLARYPLAKMHGSIRSFWKAYIHEAGLAGLLLNDQLIRAVRYSGARLIEMAFLGTQYTADFSGQPSLLLQLALNILRSPEAAAVHLLGIPLPRVRHD